MEELIRNYKYLRTGYYFKDDGFVPVYVFDGFDSKIYVAPSSKGLNTNHETFHKQEYDWGNLHVYVNEFGKNHIGCFTDKNKLTLFLEMLEVRKK